MVRLETDGAILLEGACGDADAEPLARLLLLNPAAPIDWRGCDHAHTAVVQLLLAARRATRGPPGSLFLATWVEPLLIPWVEPLLPDPKP
jgi:hypothetical protein